MGLSWVRAWPNSPAEGSKDHTTQSAASLRFGLGGNIRVGLFKAKLGYFSPPEYPRKYGSKRQTVEEEDEVRAG